jgi:HAD superfamily hydrolase (TIGR01549 family)
MGNSGQIKAVLFDFGQTLVDSADAFRAAEKEAKEKIFAALNANAKGLDWDTFLPLYRSTRKKFHQKSEFSRQAIWQHVSEIFGQKLDLDQLKKWEQSYWDQVSSQTIPFPETLEVLERLSSDFELALVSNTQGQRSSAGHRLALFPQIEAYFKVIIIAGESGIPPKPRGEPFGLCLQQLDISPHEAVFVGDDWRIDIDGAQRFGIQPVWLQHSSVKRNWPDVQTDAPVITNLRELFDLPVFHQV